MSKAKRGATDLNGILAVNKPSGMTSHDVVNRLRRITGEGRIGHAGTLDPAATGLLVICIGPATKHANALMAGRKTYEARILFGTATDTDDAEGKTIATASIPVEIGDEDFACGILAGFVGEQQQLPPQFAAIKKNGKKAYDLARAGKYVELEPRTITMYALRLITATSEYWDVEAEVSKGTYIRALARDLGEAVGSKAHMAALCRTKSGILDLNAAHTLEELEETGVQPHLLDSSVFLSIMNVTSTTSVSAPSTTNTTSTSAPSADVRPRST